MKLFYLFKKMWLNKNKNKHNLNKEKNKYIIVMHDQ